MFEKKYKLVKKQKQTKKKLGYDTRNLINNGLSQSTGPIQEGYSLRQKASQPLI